MNTVLVSFKQEMSTAPRPRSARFGFGKFRSVPAAPRDF